MFDPRRVLRALYVGRLFLAATLLLAALSVWRDPKGSAPLIAGAALASALAFTSVSFFLTEIRGKKPGMTFSMPRRFSTFGWSPPQCTSPGRVDNRNLRHCSSW